MKLNNINDGTSIVKWSVTNGVNEQSETVIGNFHP